MHWYLSYAAGVLHVIHSGKVIDCCAGLIPVNSLHAISYTIKFLKLYIVASTDGLTATCAASFASPCNFTTT